MATEAGTAYVSFLPSARGLARELRKTFAQEVERSGIERLIEQQLAGVTAAVSVVPEVEPGDAVVPVRADTFGLAAEVSAAVARVEDSITADIDTEPAGAGRYERELRAQVADVARRVTANVDVDVDADRADVVGDSVGRSLAGRIKDSLSSSLSAVPAPLMFAPVIAAAAVAAPLAGAAIAGGILAGLGGGVIALGILGVKDDPRFQAAASDLGATIKTTLTKAAGPLLGDPGKPGPLLRAMETLKQLVIDIGPSLEQMFAAIGPYLPGLAEGIAAFVKEAMPGLVEGVKAAGPILEVIALNLGPLGESLGGFLSTMASLGPAAADALNVIFFTITSVIDLAGALIYVLGAAFGGLFQNIKDARDQIVAAWNMITAAFSGGTRTVQRLVEVAVGAALRLWRNLTDRLTGGTRAAISTVTSFFGGLPGRIRGAVGNLGNLLFQAGRNVVQGLINGLRSMFGALGNAAGSLAGTIRNYLPFSPAKEGPLSGRGNPFYSGQSIVELLASGITGNLGAARAAAADLAGTFALGGSPLATAPSAPYGLSTAAPAPARLRAEWVGGDGDPIVRAIRESVRIYYGGDPDAAFGS